SYTVFAPLDYWSILLTCQASTLPLIDSDSGTQIGYVRVSQSRSQIDDTLTQLDRGLVMGVLVSLGISGVGVLWMNHQAMLAIEASFQRLKQFTADASHELRSPLMVILSNVEVALKYPEELWKDDRDMLLAIASATTQMTKLTEDLLLLARSDRLTKGDRQPGLDRQPMDISTLLKNLVALYQPQAQIQAIALNHDVAPDLTIWGDADQITRALTNLIQNALQYTPEGGQVLATAQPVHSQIHITVQDTGIGIAPEHLPKVFERFWRADAARSHDQGGSGLGLAIAQVIVQHHGGTLTVTSQIDKGSCFRVQLPIAEKR
ncbi:MAG: HAMP domain-containing sensor histidine kinase, partial [Elainellaceae cyanobacterium]